MSTQTVDPISFEQFRRLVADKLEVDLRLVVPEASFLEDLFADSIQLVDLMLQLEDEGIAFPLEAAWQIKTVGDAYRVYLESLSPPTGTLPKMPSPSRA